MGQHTQRVGVRRTRTGLLALTSAAIIGINIIGVNTLGSGPAAAGPASVESGGSEVSRNDGLAPIAEVALRDLQLIRSGDAGATTDYEGLRTAIATEIARRVDIDPARMIQAWEAADPAHQAALMAAFTQLGVPYRRMASKPGVGLDCSGLTTFAWGAAGVTLTRQSGAQIKAASPRSHETAMAGDLVYYPGHVMMYLGVDNTIIHSPYTGRRVEVDRFSTRKSVKFGNPIG
ncbi:MAG: NlpC/P60 family protein [Ilumatobacteraceae bacterium]